LLLALGQLDPAAVAVTRAFRVAEDAGAIDLFQQIRRDVNPAGQHELDGR